MAYSTPSIGGVNLILLGVHEVRRENGEECGDTLVAPLGNGCTSRFAFPVPARSGYLSLSPGSHETTLTNKIDSGMRPEVSGPATRV